MPKTDGENVAYDIVDGDSLILTKAMLLGCKLTRLQDTVDSHKWRYSVSTDTGVKAYADWPLRCYMLAIEQILEEQA